MHRRRPLLLWLSPLLLLALSVESRAGRADWPVSRGDLQGTAALYLEGVGDVEIQPWQFQASSHVWGYQPGMSVWSSAALGLVRGRPVVFVGSYDNNLYSLDAVTGEKRWRFTTGGGIYAAPVLWQASGHALVFVGASDRLVYALDADLGRREWIYAIKSWRSTIGGARLSSPCLGKAGEKDAVFIGHWIWDKSMSGHLQAGGVTALDALSGKLLWTTQLGDNQISSPIFAVLEGAGRVFIASENGNLYGLDAATGRVLWAHADRDAIKGSPVLFHTPLGSRLIIGSKYGRVRCLDAATGRDIWHFKTDHWVDGSAAVAELDGRPVIFIGSYDNHLYSLDGMSGVVNWSYRMAAGVYGSPALVQFEGQLKVLISAWDHHLHCLDANKGTLLWSLYLGRPLWNSITLGDSIWASPSAAVLDGRAVVYLGSYSGPFYAIPLKKAAQEAMARPGSNMNFWLTLPLIMLVTAALTLVMTRRHRRRQA